MLENLVKYYNPLFFDLDKINVINSAFYNTFFDGDDKYESVQKETSNGLFDKTYFRNGQRITRDQFNEKAKKKICIEKNVVTFIENNNICNLNLYIKPNYEVLLVVTVEFGNEEELNDFKPSEWFGQEVSEKFYNEKNLWNIFKSTNMEMME